MTEQERQFRELDCWHAEHVFKSAIVRQVSPRRFEVRYCMDTIPGGVGCGGFKSAAAGWDYLWHQIKHPTTDRAASQEVLERCCEKVPIVQVYRGSVFYEVYTHELPVKDRGAAATLPLAICLFAKKLFGKE